MHHQTPMMMIREDVLIFCQFRFGETERLKQDYLLSFNSFNLFGFNIYKHDLNRIKTYQLKFKDWKQENKLCLARVFV
jgi:hypothetical protein